MATANTNARTTIAALRDIMPDTVLTDGELSAFINTAYDYVQAVLIGKDIGASLLAQIEKYLAAHFAATADPVPESESVGDEYSVKYQGQSGTGFSATRYGQMALALDVSGTLASLSEGKKRPSMLVFETPEKTETI